MVTLGLLLGVIGWVCAALEGTGVAVLFWGLAAALIGFA